jgi:hypothetical protein
VTGRGLRSRGRRCARDASLHPHGLGGGRGSRTWLTDSSGRTAHSLVRIRSSAFARPHSLVRTRSAGDNVEDVAPENYLVPGVWPGDRHVSDRTALCPVMTAAGYRPSEPVEHQAGA